MSCRPQFHPSPSLAPVSQASTPSLPPSQPPRSKIIPRPSPSHSLPLQATLPGLPLLLVKLVVLAGVGAIADEGENLLSRSRCAVEERIPDSELPRFILSWPAPERLVLESTLPPCPQRPPPPSSPPPPPPPPGLRVDFEEGQVDAAEEEDGEGEEEDSCAEGDSLWTLATRLLLVFSIPPADDGAALPSARLATFLCPSSDVLRVEWKH